MPNSYTQVHIQFVFAVKYRAALKDSSWKDELHQYVTGIIRENNHKMLQVNSMPDHMHVFIGMRPHQSISALMQNVKSACSKWINASKHCPHPFAWQEGYGAFSYAKSQVADVVRYIHEQEAHHRKVIFLDEYRKFLTAFDIEWEEQYIFKALQ